MGDRLIELFSLTLDIPESSLSDRTSPATTPKWDSMANMLLIAAIEETFEIELSTSEIESMKTIGKVREILEERHLSTHD